MEGSGSREFMVVTDYDTGSTETILIMCDIARRKTAQMLTEKEKDDYLKKKKFYRLRKGVVKDYSEALLQYIKRVIRIPSVPPSCCYAGTPP